MATKAKKETNTEDIVIQKAKVNHAIIVIEGDGDLVLNKMNASNERALLADDRKAQALWERQHYNEAEQIITAMHWRDGLPISDTNAECTMDLLEEMLKNNAPCITAFGLKKSWGQAVCRNEIDKYSTKFDNAVNIVAPRGLVPITFANHFIDIRLMTPKRGSPVTVRLNHFQGWKAEVPISYTEHVYSISEIATIIDYSGFGLGIGSGRTSGYGRYHVIDIK
jgi:hypothetical protein